MMTARVAVRTMVCWSLTPTSLRFVIWAEVMVRIMRLGGLS